MTVELGRNNIGQALQRLFGLRGAVPFSLEQSVLPTASVDLEGTAAIFGTPFEGHFQQAAVAAQFSYVVIGLPNGIQGDQRSIIEEVGINVNGPQTLVVWDVRTDPNVAAQAAIQTTAYGETQPFDPATSQSFASFEKSPLVREVGASATDFITFGVNMPAQNGVWIFSRHKITLRAGQFFVVRPSIVNETFDVFVKGRHYSG